MLESLPTVHVERHCFANHVHNIVRLKVGVGIAENVDW